MAPNRPSKTAVPQTPRHWNLIPVPLRVSARAYFRHTKGANGCWISTYSTASHGYAQIGWQENGERHVVLAHRASWVHVYGQVPTGFTLDHTCKQSRCVNPDHLRLLSNFENARRTDGRDWPIGECANGHPNDLLVERADGSVICGECRRVHVGRYNWRRRHPGEEMPARLLLKREVELTA